MFCSCCWRVRSRGVTAFLSIFSAYKTIARTLFIQLQRCKRWYPFSEEKGNLLVSFILSELHSYHLQQWTSMLSGYHWMTRDFRGYSPVQHSTFLGSLVRSDPKPSHFLFVFQHSPELRRQDPGFVFARHSGRTSATCPSRNPSSVSRAMKFVQSTWLSRRFLFSLEWIDKISRGIHSEYLWNTWLHRRLSEIHGQEVLCTFLHLRQVCSSVLDLVFLLQAL